MSELTRAESGRRAGDQHAGGLAPIDAEHPPAHLLLGSDALGLVRGKLDALKDEFDAWETVTVSTNG
jgi:hypothetical protein